MIAAAVMIAVLTVVLAVVTVAGLIATRRKLADDAAHDANRRVWSDLELYPDHRAPADG